MNKPFILCTNPLHTGLGAMSLQEGNGKLFPVAIAIKKLSPTQRWHSTVERECLVLVWGLQKFNLYLYSKCCDQLSLKFLNTAKLTNNRIMRWTLKVQPYCFQVESIPGTDNLGADHLDNNYLSRVETKGHVLSNYFTVFYLNLYRELPTSLSR